MTDEAPTAADVQALIAELIREQDSVNHLLRDSQLQSSQVCGRAAAALAAQAQRIALQAGELIAANSNAHRWQCRALRQAPPREPTVGMIEACFDALMDRGYRPIDDMDVPRLLRKVLDAAPAAAPGEG